jgi:hypothetical protein
MSETDEDRAFLTEGEKYAQKHAATFCAEHAKEMEALIGTYADGKAEELLANLREQFWSVPTKDGDPITPTRKPRKARR